MDTLQSYLDVRKNEQVGIRLIGETETRTMTVLRAQADYVELTGMFGGPTYAEQTRKQIRVPYTAIAWLE